MKNIIIGITALLFVLLMAGPGLCAEENKEEPPFEDTIEALIDLLREKGVIGDGEAEKFIKRYKSGIQGKEKGKIVTIIPDQESKEYFEQITEEMNKALKEDVTETKDKLDYITNELMTRSRLLERKTDELEKKLVEDVGEKLNNSAWANRIRWGGDIRLRYQKDFYDEKNGVIWDADSDGILNTTVDRARYRYRLRLEAKAEVMKKDPELNVGKVEVGARVATGNTDDPVSTNDTLGDYFSYDSVIFDKAYVKWTYKPDYPKFGKLFPQVTALGGRFTNPFFSTDLVWDHDVNLEGLALKIDSDTLMENPLKFYLTVGAFPLQEIELYEKDKWLYAAQFGINYERTMGLSARSAISYYNYKNTRGQFFNDPSGSFSNDTDPLFRQIGNILMDINTDPDHETWALAGDYRLINITAELDYDFWFPNHIILRSDYVKNIGFDSDKVAQFIGWDTYPEEIEGYQFTLLYGYPTPRGFGEWNASISYKYLEGDATLDAFADSDFHFGGTNAKGWILKWEYGISDNMWFSGRWVSSDEIRGTPIAIDKFFLDFNARF